MKKNSGITLIELLIAITIFSAIVPVMIILFNTITSGFTSYEAKQHLKTANQQLLNDIYLNLGETKRIFDRGSAFDLVVLSRVDLTGCPGRAFTNPNLSISSITPTGDLSPGSTDFVPAHVGNSLFYAANTDTQISANVAGSSGSTYTVRTDCYRFFYYYLTAEYDKKLYSTVGYNVYKWVSVKYADYSQLNSILLSDALKCRNTIIQLYNNGIQYAWVTSEKTNISNAFYQLDAAGNMNLMFNPPIPRDSRNSKLLIDIVVGQLGGGYRYGIAPNSVIWAKSPVKVPLYGTVNGNFPAGFEVVIVGNSSARKILVRSAIIAQGSMKSIVSNDQVLVAAARDLW